MGAHGCALQAWAWPTTQPWEDPALCHLAAAVAAAAAAAAAPPAAVPDAAIAPAAHAAPQASPAGACPYAPACAAHGPHSARQQQHPCLAAALSPLPQAGRQS
eukprot:790802-Pelagomonas_calceolata.AAC.1